MQGARVPRSSVALSRTRSPTLLVRVNLGLYLLTSMYGVLYDHLGKL